MKTEEEKEKDDMDRMCLKNMDYPAYRQGRRDADRGIYGFNPYCAGTLRYLSYEAGNN